MGDGRLGIGRLGNRLIKIVIGPTESGSGFIERNHSIAEL